jgi:hypothetical protein
MYCPRCQKETHPEWIYCHYCGEKLRESNIYERYERIISLYEYEQTRRQTLESKSATYIGLISVIVTILLAVGNVLFNSLGDFSDDYASAFKILFALYICSVAGFTLSAVFAFRAYHTGSVLMSQTKAMRILNSVLDKLMGTEVYRIVSPDLVLQFETENPEQTKRELMEIYARIWKKNYDLNNLKSDRILASYAFSSISLAIVVVTGIIVLIFKM